MGRYIIKRLLWMIPIIVGVTILIFTILYFTPGDPARAILGYTASEAEIQAKREELGLNDPYFVQLFNYIKQVFINFDLGKTYGTQVPIVTQLKSRLPKTFIISILCMIVGVGGGIPLGIFAAVHQNKLADRATITGALIFSSMPDFFIATMLMLIFALRLKWLPAFGSSSLKHYILPVISGSIGSIAMMAKQTRSSMLEVIRSDYVTMARAKGCSERTILWKHSLKNALIPIITIMGAILANALSGVVIIENVFTIPGMGTYLTSAVSGREYNVIRGCVLLLSIWMALIMLLVDIVYAFVDPRIRAQYERMSMKKKK